MDPIELIKIHYDTLTKAEQKGADFILQNPQSVLNNSLTSLACQSGASNAALIRMCQKLGFDGFAEFKFSVNRYLISHGTEAMETEETSTQTILNTYTRYLNLLPVMVPEETLQLLAQKICSARYIEIWGINRTAQSAKQLSNRLGRLGIYNKMTDDWVAMTDDAEILSPEDLCILFSLNGRGCSTYGQMMDSMRSHGCPVVLVTANPRIKLTASADLVITLPWISHENKTNFFEDQIIVYMFIELLLFEVAKQTPLMQRRKNI